MTTFEHDVQFQKLRTRSGKIDFVRFLTEIAADAYPRLDKRAIEDEIDRLGRTAEARLPRGSSSTRDQLLAISRFLFEEEGFHGSLDDYYDPRNSYLNEVLKRRAGIPITLSLLYQAVAARAGVRLHGVATPGHFVLSCPMGNNGWYVDAFAEGEILTPAECWNRIQEQLGEDGVLCIEHFRPARSIDIAVRVLRNLKTAHAMRNEWMALLPIQQRLALLLPGCTQEARDLGLVLLRTGQGAPALRILKEYVQSCEPCESECLAPYLRAAQRLVHEMN